jgi:ferredoxin
MAKQLVIEIDECMGCESCVEVCPDVFYFDETTEKAYVKEGITGNEECIQEAIETCPEECIYWEEE